MGLTAGSLKFLLSALDMGCRTNSVCTLGRLHVMMRAKEIERLLKEHGRCSSDFWDRFPWRNELYFADDVFRILGVKDFDSLDYSGYEGASIVHDMNLPVPESLRGVYDLVVDGGTLEHVFNYPVALAGAMSLVRLGGHMILDTPMNNLCGHGFYQFSPELFFRVFSSENGFELMRIYVRYKGRYYHVVDPVVIRGRVELRSSDGAMLMVHARKIADVTPFVHCPQQSDYLAAWTEAPRGGSPAVDGWLKRLLRNRLSREQVQSISRVLNRFRQRRRIRRWYRESCVSNQRFYIPVDRWDVPTWSVTGASDPSRACQASVVTR